MSRGDEAEIILPSSDRRIFERAFEAISRSGQVTILAEGTPLYSSLNSIELADLEKTLPLTAPVSMREVITKVAAAFDYDVELYTPQVYLLRKRYTDPLDLPCVTYDELIDAMKQVGRLVSEFVPAGQPLDDGTSLQKLYASLSVEQKEKAKNGIALRDLSSSQHDLAMRVAQYLELGSEADDLRYVLGQLSVLDKPDTAFTHMSPADIPSFGLRYIYPETDKTVNRPFTNRWDKEGRHPAKITDGTNATPEAQVAAENERYGPDPTIPTDVDRAILQTLNTVKFADRMTLGDLAKSEDTQASEMSISVAAGIESKPISVFGRKLIAKNVLATAMTQLYGLDLQVPHAGDYHIDLPRAKTPHDGSSFKLAVQQVVPSPIRRSLDGQTARVEKSGRFKKSPDEKNDPLRTVVTVINGVHIDNTPRDVAYSACYYPADHRVLLMTEPKVPQVDSPPVPLSQIDPEVKRLLSLMFMAGTGMRTIDRLCKKSLPQFLTDPDSMILTLDMSGNSQFRQLRIQFGHWDEAGKFHMDNTTSTIEPLPN